MFVVVVWFCSSSSLAFLISAYLINLMHLFSLHWVFGLEAIFLLIHQFFFEKYLNFLCFSICSSFGRQLCQNCGWAGSEPYVRLHITEPPCINLSWTCPRHFFVCFQKVQTFLFSFYSLYLELTDVQCWPIKHYFPKPTIFERFHKLSDKFLNYLGFGY